MVLVSDKAASFGYVQLGGGPEADQDMLERLYLLVGLGVPRYPRRARGVGQGEGCLGLSVSAAAL